MRGDERFQNGMFRNVSLELRVRMDHSLRGIHKLTNAVLASLDVEFDNLYKNSGRQPIAGESGLGAQPVAAAKTDLATTTCKAEVVVCLKPSTAPPTDSRSP